MKADNPPYLLAKWRTKDWRNKTYFEPRGYRFEDHIAACVRMAVFMLADAAPFGTRMYKASALADQGIDYTRFERLCILAVAVHDLGKANSEFQRMIWDLEDYYQSQGRAQPDDERYTQRIRHEHITMYILTRPDWPYWDWLVKQVGGNVEDAWVVACAAFGHHRKTDRDIQPEGTAPLYIYLERLRSINPILKSVGFDPLPDHQNLKLNTKDEEAPQIRIHNAMEAVQEAHAKEQEAFNRDPKRAVLSTSVKLVTILCDVLGSMTSDTAAGLPQFENKLKAAINRIYRPRTINFHAAIKQVVRDNPNAFQKRAVEFDGDVLLIAGTGSGKTSFAYFAAQNHQFDPIIFTVPFTAAASDLYLARQHWCAANGIPMNDAVRHSHTALDEEALNAVMTSNGDPEDQEATADEDSIDKTLGRFTDITDATVDQVLGALTFNRKAILWLLHIVQSQIVFDEHHSYDRKLTEYFLRFLEFFPGIRVILLSATVTKQQMARIVAVRPRIRILQDTPNTAPRYYFHILASKAEAYGEIKDGGLVICNTIASAQEWGTRVPQAEVLHSRKRRKERRDHERQLIPAFRKAPLDFQVISTQIAEMSLDISAVMGIIEICPPAQVIQRCGRINRMYHDDHGVAHVYFYMPASKFPYVWEGATQAAVDCPDYQAWLAWIKALSGRVLSQQDLSDAFDALIDKTTQLDLPADTLYHTTRKSLRLLHPTHLAFLKSDVTKHPEILTRGGWKEAQHLEIPVMASKGRLKGLKVENRHYIVNWDYTPRLGLILPGATND